MLRIPEEPICLLYVYCYAIMPLELAYTEGSQLHSKGTLQEPIKPYRSRDAPTV
jgi:hypothetical protein